MDLRAEDLEDCFVLYDRDDPADRWIETATPVDIGQVR